MTVVAPSHLEASGLVKEFKSRTGGHSIRAVDGIDIAIGRGELVAVVGESGSGKSTLGRLLMGLEVPSAGEIRLAGRPVQIRTARERLEYWRSVQLVFQDPFACLNPTRTVGQLLARPYRNFVGSTRRAALGAVEELLERVNLSPGSSFLDRYPHELSGGQRQRVVLARALAVDPAFVIADEPVSMLDVSVRAGILALIDRIRREREVGFLYITHDIVSAYQVADRVVVMYGGRVMEEGLAEDVIGAPQHPYTRLLLAAVPGAGAVRREQPTGREAGALALPPPAPTAAGRAERSRASVVRSGTVPQALSESRGSPGGAQPATADGRRRGCPFVQRCPLALDVCSLVDPPRCEAEPGHVMWCHALGASVAHEAGAARRG